MSKDKDEKPAKEPDDSKGPPSKKGFNKFILDELYPDPLKTLQSERPSMEAILKDCVFAIDTSSLLTPFEIGDAGAKEIAKIFRELTKEQRLFFPKRALQEFLNRRTHLLVRICEKIANNKSHLPEVSTLKIPFLETDPEFKELKQQESQLKADKESYKDAIDKLVKRLSDWIWDDDISKLYKEIVSEQSVIDHGMKPKEIEADLERRTTHKIPPGFEDAKKPDGGIGDLLIWHSLLKLGKDTQKNVVFISNEKKPDWVLKTAFEKVVSCRPEILEEFHAKTKRHFCLIDFPSFLKLTGASPETVDLATFLAAFDSIETDDQMDFVTDDTGFIYHQATIEIAKLVKSYLERGEKSGFGNTPIPPAELYGHVNSLRVVADRDPLFASFGCSSSHHTALYGDILDCAEKVVQSNDLMVRCHELNLSPPSQLIEQIKQACSWFLNRSQEVWEGRL